MGVPTSIEDQVRSKFYTPSPHAYRPKIPDVGEPKAGGKISESRIPSGHDYEAKNKSWVPGPGSYQTPDMKDFALPDGGRVNRKPPVVKMAMVDEYPTPDPGHYGVPSDPTQPRQVNGRFSKDPRVTEFIAIEVKRSKGIPGPGAHDVMEAMDNAKPFCPSGGKTLHFGRGKNYFELATVKSEGLPAPDRYDLPGSIVADRCTGRAVFKYESATIKESKAMVARICSDAPAPGTYTLGDCPPIVNPITMRSRALGHAMPAPFNYHCAPDLARKYAPVLKQNSGNEIFGNGVVKQRAKSENPRFTGNPSRDSRPSSAGSNSNSYQKEKSYTTEVPQASNLSFRQTDLDMNPEDAVQWRSGGFAPMQKSRSMPMVRGPTTKLNPILEETKKSYPDLHKREKGMGIVETVSTGENADEYHRIARGKVKLSAVAQGIHSASTSVLVPFDLDKMKRQAAETLLDKARNRLNAEGFDKNQMELVLGEMRGVMGQKVGLDLRPNSPLKMEVVGQTEEHHFGRIGSLGS